MPISITIYKNITSKNIANVNIYLSVATQTISERIHRTRVTYQEI